MRKSIQISLIAWLLCAITGCASIVSGNKQSVSVNTNPAANARCTLVNNKGSWSIPRTPGSVVVTSSFNDMNVTCQKAGYARATQIVGSNTKPIAFGNIIFGGAIGASIDMADGAAYRYPSNISVHMRKA